MGRLNPRLYASSLEQRCAALLAPQPVTALSVAAKHMLSNFDVLAAFALEGNHVWGRGTVLANVNIVETGIRAAWGGDCIYSSLQALYTCGTLIGPSCSRHAVPLVACLPHAGEGGSRPRCPARAAAAATAAGQRALRATGCCWRSVTLPAAVAPARRPSLLRSRPVSCFG